MTAVGERVRVRPHGMSYRGTAVARLEGQAVFIAGALPGEEVVAEIERGRRDFLEAHVVEVLSPSPHRVEPRCSHFGEAGSCEWEFIAYPEQLRLKNEILRDQFRRVGHLVDLPIEDAIASPAEYGYRNHVRFAINAAGEPCFLRRASHIPVPIEACAVLHPALEAMLPDLWGQLRGLKQVELRHGVNTGESLITPSLRERGLELPSGQSDYHEALLGRRYRISAASFFQVNTGVAEALVQLLLDELALDGSERVADLYAGVGAFACLLAPQARTVVAVEAAPAAVEDGRLNSGFLENVRYRKGEVERVLPVLSPVPNVVVMDPPRSGCEQGTIAALLAGRARRITYISCDAATQARDIRLLVDGGYELRSLRAIDMFPQTYHIESLAILERIQS